MISRKRTLPCLLLLGFLATPIRAATFEELRARFLREKKQPYSVRIETVRAIADLETPEAVRFLVKVVKEDEDRSVRLNTIYQVARIPLPSAWRALLGFYRGSDASMRSSAFSAIVSYRQEALPEEILDEVLAGTDQGMRSNAIRYLARRKDPRFLREVERFLEQFPRGGTSLISVLVQAATPEAARILVRLYDDARRYDRDQVPKMFAKADPKVRAVLGEAVAKAARPLKVNAATLAARAGVAEAEPAMAAAIAGADPELRAILVESIGSVGATTEAGRRAILDALREGEVEIVVAGVRAVRRAPLKEAVPVLIDLLGRGDRILAAEARVTLERITGQQYGERADLWKKWWENYGAGEDLPKPRDEPAGEIDQALVDLAIEKGAAALRAIRGKAPPWEYASRPAGTTALVVLALHASGADLKDPDLRAGVRYLLESPVPQYTYELGLEAMALEAVGGKHFRRRIGECAKRLVATQLEGGLWGYPTGNGDHSNTQYAVLGLRSAARAGIAVPPRVWRSIRDHFLRVQGGDGGWSYTVTNRATSSASMTAAGVTCLLICLENMGRDDAQQRRLRAALDRGFTALGKLMRLDTDTLYALYGMERAGVLGRRNTFDGKPWYAPGARRLVDEQGRDGHWRGSYNEAIQTSFAILFLKKATVPISTR